MVSNQVIGSCQTFNGGIETRNNPMEVWKDILTYSSNLTGNWLLSKHIFYVCIVPTAERNPARFARWVKEMVKKSGLKIKSRAEFIEAINYLRKYNPKQDKTGIRKALYRLFESGLEESAYASKALQNKSA